MVLLAAFLVCGVVRGQDAGPSVESTSSGGILLRAAEGQDVQVRVFCVRQFLLRGSRLALLGAVMLVARDGGADFHDRSTRTAARVCSTPNECLTAPLSSLVDDRPRPHTKGGASSRRRHNTHRVGARHGRPAGHAARYDR